MSALNAAVHVSPMIKFFRWSFLGSGILYGVFHQNRLSKREVVIREVEAKQKAIRDVKLAEEKKIQSDREIMELEKLAGIRKD